MKTKIHTTLVLAVMTALLFQLTAFAQTTAFTYQGRLDEGAVPANGTYDLTFSVWVAESGAYPVGISITNTAVAVSNGLFSVILNFGAMPFTGQDRWLEVGVRTNGGGEFSTLSPRQRLTSTPYAFRAQQAATTAPNAVDGVSLQNNVVTSDKIQDGSIGAMDIDASQFNTTFWRASGNAGTTAGTHFLGTTDNQPLEFKANNQRVLRFSDAGGGWVNITAGCPSNSATQGGATVAGGGDSSYPNVASLFGFVGGGSGNTAIGGFATVAGGDGNFANGFSFVGGGKFNTNGHNYGVIGGGLQNTNIGSHSVIGGGRDNMASGSEATIGGGMRNVSFSGVVAGGHDNQASWGTVGGGDFNIAVNATIAGGLYNTASNGAAIGGGYQNQALGTGTSIGGGNANRAEGWHGTVAGGYRNSSIGTLSVTAGGQFNTNRGYGGVISGGLQNTNTGDFATIGGGRDNTASGYGATVPGGEEVVAAGRHSLAAGRKAAALHDGSFVWADDQGAAFSSTGQRQFLVRAEGGVGIGTNFPQAMLHVVGTVLANSFSGDGSGLTGVQVSDASGLTNGTLPSSALGGTYSRALSFTHASNTFAGSFAGNGGGLTSLNAASLAMGTLADLRLSTNVALRNANQAFAGINSFVHPDNSFSGSHSGNGAGLTNLNAGSLAGGLVPEAQLGGNIARTNQVWLLGGNSGTTPGTHYIGTTDSQPLEFKVNGLRVLRVENNGDSFSDSGSIPDGAPNVIGGSPLNFVAVGVVGATIGGGGATNYWDAPYTNSVLSDFGVVGGGYGNTIAAGARGATVAGGYLSSVFAEGATVAGGGMNRAMSDHATVGGGLSNSATNSYATVPGGRNNLAGGQYSFAAGRQAKALHDGTFVWADSTAADFASTASNQFLIRASGGVGIGTVNPAAQLDVSSGGLDSFPQARLNQTSAGDYSRLRFTVGGDYTKRWDMACRSNIFVLYSGQFDANMLQLDSAGLTVRGTFVSSSDRNLKENFQPVDARAVLAKVIALPLNEWSYKQDTTTRHIGPMAQDFYAAFAVGPDDKHIATVDADGVALAAIQGLNQKLEGRSQRSEARSQLLEEKLEQKETEIAELKQSMNDLKRLVEAMSHKLNGGVK